MAQKVHLRLTVAKAEALNDLGLQHLKSPT